MAEIVKKERLDIGLCSMVRSPSIFNLTVLDALKDMIPTT
jgi:hypothetical protein